MAKYIAASPRTYSGKNGSVSHPGMVVTINTIGVPRLIQALKNYTKQVERAAERGVSKAAKFLLKETLKVTPKQYGVLRSAGKTSVRKEGMKTVGIVYFDDDIAPYSVYVHEDLTKYHKPPTMAKFLQRTQWKNRGNISRIIREEVAKARAL